MLEWDILNYLKKWRTNLRATFKSVRYDRRAEGVSAESDVQDVSVSERKHKVFFPMDVLLGRVIHVVFCLQETCFLQTKD